MKYVTCQPDACLTRERTILRFIVLALLFLHRVWNRHSSDSAGGSALRNPTQLNSGVYSGRRSLHLSRNRNNMQPFLLSCPVVRRQLPLLVRRYLGFLAALFVLQTTALKLRPNLPAHLSSPSPSASLFAVILGCLCACLAIVHVLSNRSLLERAHLSVQAKAA